MEVLTILKKDVHFVLVLYSVTNKVDHDCFTTVCGRERSQSFQATVQLIYSGVLKSLYSHAAEVHVDVSNLISFFMSIHELPLAMRSTYSSLLTAHNCAA